MDKNDASFGQNAKVKVMNPLIFCADSNAKEPFHPATERKVFSRLDAQTYKALKEMAGMHNRSINREIRQCILVAWKNHRDDPVLSR